MKKPRKRLTRRQKLVRNLCLTAAMLLVLAAALEFGSLSPEGAFHRQEKQYLVQPSRVIIREKISNTIWVGGSGRLRYLMGVGEHHIAQGTAHYNGYGTWRLEEFRIRPRERVVAMPLMRIYANSLDVDMFNTTNTQAETLRILVYSEIEAASARLTLDFRFDGTLNEQPVYGDIYAAEAIPDENGLYFFTLGLEETDEDIRYFFEEFSHAYNRQSYPAVIEFFDSGGGTIQAMEITVG